MDILAGGFKADDVVWYKNNHPRWSKEIIDANLDGPRLFALADLDGDEIQDVIVPGKSSVVWYKNPFNSTQKLIQSSFEYGGYEREYEVYLPQNFQPNMPLVISLHGYSETVEWYKSYTLMHEVADTMGYVIVYPQGINKSWNAGVVDPNDSYPNTNDVGFISALIDTMKNHWDIDLSRVYCCGYSLGGMMSFRLIGDIGYRFAAAASVSGPLFGLANTWEIVRPIPILQMHGTSDILVPYEGNGDYWPITKTIEYWAEKNNCNPFYSTISLPDIVPGDNCTIQKISYDSYSGESTLIHYKGIGMGHSWPGSATTFPSEGNKNMDINANVEILNFFKNYTKPEENTTTEIWTDKTDMQNERQGHSSGVLDGKIYVLGGIQFNTSSTHYNAIKSMEFYDTNLNEWTEKAEMNTGRVQFPTCIYDGKIWAIGGGQSVYWDPLTSIETYDPVEDSWTHVTVLPIARMGHTASLVNGKIYIIGGTDSNDMIPLPEIVVYNPLSDSWDLTKTDMPTPRMNLEAVVLNGKIYVMGGHGGVPNGEIGLKKVEVYDPATDTWEEKADMIWPRKYFSASVLDDNIYVFGGASGNCTSALSTVEVYDTYTDKWASGTDISTKWVMTAATSINEKIYLSGGTFQICPPSVVKTVRVYNPAQDTLLVTEIINQHNQQQPESFAISQNYPNPFNPSTTLKYEIPKESYITIKVYDILGREVATLINKQQKAGYYEVDWNAASNSSGIYFYKIQAGDFVDTKKMILMK